MAQYIIAIFAMCTPFFSLSIYKCIFTDTFLCEYSKLRILCIGELSYHGNRYSTITIPVSRILYNYRLRCLAQSKYRYTVRYIQLVREIVRSFACQGRRHPSKQSSTSLSFKGQEGRARRVVARDR